MKKNIITNSDSYKFSQYAQYPEGAQYISSYIESRGGKFDSTVFFGAQMFLMEYMSDPMTMDDVMEANSLITPHGFDFNFDGFSKIVTECGGYPPIEISCVEEGSVVPTGNVLLQITNTRPGYAWLVSYVETALLRAIWYPTTVATLSREIKKIIADGLTTTQGNTAGLEFKLHDFGFRGASSTESAGIGGLAHLVNFMGTDTFEAVRYGRHYYGENMAGFSIPASEHSTMTSWGRSNEVEAYRNMLNKYHGKMFACVSDSYDIWNAIDIWGTTLKEEVLSHAESGGVLVIRPDSGDPVSTPIDCIEALMKHFGYETTDQGYKVLPPFIRVIQGDGINKDDVKSIVDEMINRKLCINNIAFGMGGGLLQSVTRDTCKFAMKASAIMIGNSWIDVYKDPITDKGKTSKKGVLKLIKTNEEGYKTIRQDKYSEEHDELKSVYFEGNITRSTTLSQVRKNAKL